MQRKSAEKGLGLYDSAELETIVHSMARQAAALLPPGQSALVGILRHGG